MKCIVIDDDSMIRMQIKKFAEKSKFLDCIALFENPIDALNDPSFEEAELIFVDIEMPEMSGFEFIKAVKDLPLFIVISGKEEYAVEALTLDAIDYLLKPIEYSRFLKAVQKAKAFANKKNKDTQGIFIKDGSTKLIRLNFDEILWIQALENYVLIVTETDKHTVHFTMKSLEKQLPSDKFIRTHRSYIVNFNKIISIEENIAVIKYKDKKKSVPVAKSYKDKLMKKINIISK